MSTKKKLTTYEAVISEDLQSGLMVDAVAVVDKPAINSYMLHFNEHIKRLNFLTVNEEQRIVVGAAMIPDLLIYRNNELGEHNVFFTAQTIQSIAEKFYSLGFQANVNEMHDASKPINGMVFFMSFLRISAKGLIGLEGDYPEGTWFLGAKVTDDTVWAKVQSGEYTGFSVEGEFGYKLTQTAKEEKLAQEIENLMLKENPELSEIEKIFLQITGTE